MADYQNKQYYTTTISTKMQALKSYCTSSCTYLYPSLTYTVQNSIHQGVPNIFCEPENCSNKTSRCRLMSHLPAPLISDCLVAGG